MKKKSKEEQTEEELKKLKREISETNHLFASSFSWLALMVLALALLVFLAMG